MVTLKRAYCRIIDYRRPIYAKTLSIFLKTAARRDSVIQITVCISEVHMPPPSPLHGDGRTQGSQRDVRRRLGLLLQNASDGDVKRAQIQQIQPSD
jgi:hypothetical protein